MDLLTLFGLCIIFVVLVLSAGYYIFRIASVTCVCAVCTWMTELKLNLAKLRTRHVRLLLEQRGVITNIELLLHAPVSSEFITCQHKGYILHCHMPDAAGSYRFCTHCGGRQYDVGAHAIKEIRYGLILPAPHTLEEYAEGVVRDFPVKSIYRD